MEIVKVEVITIGDEILIGQIVDTNSAWMAVELNKLGFELVQITSIADDALQIKQALDLALKRADVVLVTGGIGPTKDDVTKQTLSEYFASPLVFNAEVYSTIESILIKRSRVMNELTKSQAFVPVCCKVIQNDVGTAPVTWFDIENKTVVSMPGVPYEMMHVMKCGVLPDLQRKYSTGVLCHQTVLVYGIPESALAMRLEEWELSLPEDMKLAYLPNYGIVKLRLTIKGGDEFVLKERIASKIEELKTILGSSIVAFEDVLLSELVGGLLRDKAKTLAVAESCTGGNISHELTLIPGSSMYFKGAVVAYSNDIKVDFLGVSQLNIDSFGAVSREVVGQMAEGVRKRMGADFGIASSGVAGPGGGTELKPAGKVWLAISSENQVICWEENFSGSREQVIERATQAVFVKLVDVLGCI